MKNFYQILKKHSKETIWLFAFIIFAAVTFEMINRPFGTVRSLKIAFDDQIPFIKEMILIYQLYMPLIGLTGLLLIRHRIVSARQFIFNLFVAQLAAYLIFYFFQTEVPRYDINRLGNDFFSDFIRLTYTVDNSFCGAPSLHVCNMTVCSIYFWMLPYRKSVRFTAIVLMFLVAISTVLVKQHVFLDIPTGFLHALITFGLTQWIWKQRHSALLPDSAQ
ncbi:MAG: phosphatase PAP2 family protein [Peptoniphilaceae bacterium]|nr:phosphatase PAP2 family protein [Peptoniphilaceae bacterium]MDY5766190.1 phosphatase PAP2 family protein [Peptoniphilaceae bacterium]